jgi:mRNA-degrading endonuclease RelE of RelBE toxin-antitoxin system
MADIDFYKTRRGDCPVRDWLDRLSNGNIREATLYDAIERNIDHLLNRGTKMLGPSHVKCLTRKRKCANHIWELIVGDYRLYYSIYKGNVYVFLLYVHKKRQEAKHIGLAITKMKEWVLIKEGS